MFIVWCTSSSGGHGGQQGNDQPLPFWPRTPRPNHKPTRRPHPSPRQENNAVYGDTIDQPDFSVDDPELYFEKRSGCIRSSRSARWQKSCSYLERVDMSGVTPMIVVRGDSHTIWKWVVRIRPRLLMNCSNCVLTALRALMNDEWRVGRDWPRGCGLSFSCALSYNFRRSEL